MYATKSEKASESFISVLNYAVRDAPDDASAPGVLCKVAIRCISTHGRLPSGHPEPRRRG